MSDENVWSNKDTAAWPVAHLACPDCGEEVPVTLGEVELSTDENGQQHISVDLQTDDVWAHAWTHGQDGPA